MDRVVPEIDLDKIAAYKKYHFDVMFTGEDQKTEELYIEAEKTLRSKGMTLFIFCEKKAFPLQLFVKG